MRTRTVAIRKKEPRLVRVDHATRVTLKRLQAEARTPMTALLAEAVEDLRRKKFIEAANAEYAAIKRDPKAWKAEQAERARWDSTLRDGLRGD